MSRSARSLRRALLWSIAVTALIAALLTMVAARYFLHSEAGELLDAQLARSARLFNVARTAIPRTPDTVIELPRLAPGTGADFEWPKGHVYERHVALQIFDGTGRLLLRSANAPLEPIVPLQAGFHDSDDGWRAFVLVDPDDQAHVLVAEDHRARDELRVAFSATALLITLGGFALLLAALLTQVERCLQPVRRLAEKFARRSPDDTEPVIEPGLPAELAPLVDAINQHLARLQQALRAEQEFASRAAHELRTPLTAIRIHAENALDAGSEAERSQSLQRVREAVDRAIRMIGRLLLLTRLDRDHLRQRFSRIGVRRLLDEAASGQAPLAERQRRAIEVQATEALDVEGEIDLLLVALDTLIANALQHAAQGTITLRARSQGPEVIIEVIDEGPGPDTQGLEAIRHAIADTEDTSLWGMGLGIAGWIARAHGGRLTVSGNPAGSGLVVALHLPRHGS
ncbi:MAG: ATP-binding protein [Wenzhouxiangellaceae bacterium]